MKIRFSKRAVKFLNKLSTKEQAKIKQKLRDLISEINNNNNIPFQKLNIKTLSGEWKDYLRMRIGKMRIIFKVYSVENEIFIYDIDYRGNIYQKN